MLVVARLLPFPLHVDHKAVEVVIAAGREIRLVDEILRADGPALVDTVIELQPVTFAVRTATAEIRVSDETQHRIRFFVGVVISELHLAAILGLANRCAKHPAGIVVGRVAVVDKVQNTTAGQLPMSNSPRQRPGSTGSHSVHAGDIRRCAAGQTARFDGCITEKVTGIRRITVSCGFAFRLDRVVAKATRELHIAKLAGRAKLPTPAEVGIALLTVTLKVGADRVNKEPVPLVLEGEPFGRPVAIPYQRLAADTGQWILELACEQCRPSIASQST